MGAWFHSINHVFSPCLPDLPLLESLGSYNFDGWNRIGSKSHNILYLTGPAGTVDAPEGWLAGFNVYAANSHPFNLGIWRLTGESLNKDIYTYV